MFYLVCYDIVDDNTRYKVAKVLKSYGQRVQKSAFECQDLSERGFLKMKDKIEGLIDFTEDNVRYYRLCRRCLQDFEQSGQGEQPEIKSFHVA